ncbi:MAG: OFA family MFS transporter [Candidatus Eremiobacteraeota bacterium]|nr:OFA family MFS transporter [Candidatus Eremiobacteraeota bacterium]
MLGPGAVYSYTLLAPSLQAPFGWSTTQPTWAFALANFFLGLGGAIGGILAYRLGTRSIALFGVALWGLGNILAGYGTASYGAPWLWWTYGVVGGLGCGMAYIASVTSVIKWFPERRGFGGGLIIMGFGLGAPIYSLIIRSVPAFVDAAKAAAVYVAARAASEASQATFNAAQYQLKPEVIAGLMNLFTYSGIAFIAVGCIFAFALREPPRNFTANGFPSNDDELSYTTTEMLGTPQFYLLWVMLFLNVTAGIIVISNATGIMQELTGVAVPVVVSTYAYLAFFNGFGRLFWGWLSDRIGRRLAYALIFGIQVVSFFALGELHSLLAVAAVYAVVLLCYGGGFGVMPAFNADFFGTKHFGANYGLTITAWGCAGIVGPAFVSTVKDLTGSYAGALLPVAIMLLVAIIFPLISDRPVASRPAEAGVKT